MDKASLRAAVRTRIDALRAPVRAMEEELVNAAVVSDPDWMDAETVLVYKALGDELSVTSAANDALRKGKRVVFPKVQPGGSLSLHHVTDWGQLRPGAYGIGEPDDACAVVSPAMVDIALVPARAFTRSGQRLGRGGGFYDRLLPMLGGIAWGVAFDCQVVEDLPAEAHDRPVDRLVWPSGLLGP